MKKIVTILLAIALIAMIGTAAAGDVDFMIGDITNHMNINPDGTTVTTTDLQINGVNYITYTPSHTRTFGVMTTSPTLWVRVHNADDSFNTDWTNNAMSTVTYTANQTTNPAPILIVDVKGTSGGSISAGDSVGTTLTTMPPGGNDLLVGTVSVDIPEFSEFPVIALPVAAILGLAFIFQRRREED